METHPLTTVSTEPLEVLTPSAVELIERAAFDVQITTAHKFPRSMATFKQRASAMALIDEETAASCIYSRPVGGGKFAEGLSVRAAEIVGASFGNLRVGATIIEQTERFVKARGFAHDLESNFMVATEVVESTVKKDGTPYDERMRIVLAKSALAKARRDATFQVVPKALFRSIELECKKLALGEGMSVTQRRARITQWITKLGIDPKRVWKVLGIGGEADLIDEHFITLTGLKTAISDGDVTIDEAFPPITATGAIGAKAKTLTEQVAAEKAGAEAKKDEIPKQDGAQQQSEAESEPKTAEKPSEPPKPKGPTAAELKKKLIAKGGELNAGKVRILQVAKELEIVSEDALWDNLTVEQLDGIDSAWTDVAEKIKNP